MSTNGFDSNDSNDSNMSVDDLARHNSKFGNDPDYDNMYEEFNMSINGISHMTIIKYLERNKLLWTGNILADFQAVTEHLKGRE